jgi:hypothetical protein
MGYSKLLPNPFNDLNSSLRFKVKAGIKKMKENVKKLKKMKGKKK